MIIFKKHSLRPLVLAQTLLLSVLSAYHKFNECVFMFSWLHLLMTHCVSRLLSIYCDLTCYMQYFSNYLSLLHYWLAQHQFGSDKNVFICIATFVLCYSTHDTYWWVVLSWFFYFGLFSSPNSSPRLIASNFQWI